MGITLCTETLHLEHLALDGVGEADAARLGGLFGQGVGQERAPHVLGVTAAERAVGLKALEHRLQHHRQERALELFRGLGDAVFASGHGRGAVGTGRRTLQHHQVGGGRDGKAHHITSISAWRAPAALMACRMEIMSRGVTPRALSPLTRLASDAPFFKVISWRPRSSSTVTCDWLTTVVSPRLKGAGWLT